MSLEASIGDKVARIEASRGIGNVQTAMEVFAQRDRMEREAAQALGEIMFAFGRLETNLGVAAVWAGDPKGFEERAARLDGSSFHLKLEALSERVGAEAFGEARTVYTEWLDQADKIRRLRNTLVHARWGFEHAPFAAVCVTGLPVSQRQSATSYSIEDLRGVVGSIERLNSALTELRERWPLR
ncbi:hypothetical protein ACI2IY_02825 [Lysobacter enzymogenes]|uniref:hypothetical protein n=1 Tax=Lysobacter enzymogenes TaxID=69 RepID=UPI00384ABC02